MNTQKIINPAQGNSIKGVLGESELFVGLDPRAYHADVTVQSCSLLKPILVSPAHYRAQFFSDRSSTKFMDFGTLIHALVLEPSTFGAGYAVFPGKTDKRSDEYKAFARANVGRIVIDEVAFHIAKNLADRILSRSYKGRPFGDYVKEGIPEASIYYTDPATNVRCRARIDLLHPEFTFDLKTTICAERTAWVRQASSLDYDMQAYMYCLCVSLFYGHTKPKPFVFIAGENAAPYSVSAFTAGPTFIEEGGRKYQEALTAYAACSAVNHWPDASSEEIVELEHWQVRHSSPAWRKSLATY